MTARSPHSPPLLYALVSASKRLHPSMCPDGQGEGSKGVRRPMVDAQSHVCVRTSSSTRHLVDGHTVASTLEQALTARPQTPAPAGPPPPRIATNAKVLLADGTSRNCDGWAVL